MTRKQSNKILCLSINVPSCHTWKPKLITYLTLSQQDRHNGYPASFNPLQTCLICPLQPNSLNWMVGPRPSSSTPLSCVFHLTD